MRQPPVAFFTQKVGLQCGDLLSRTWPPSVAARRTRRSHRLCSRVDDIVGNFIDDRTNLRNFAFRQATLKRLLAHQRQGNQFLSQTWRIFNFGLHGVSYVYAKSPSLAPGSRGLRRLACRR
ncbi:hypothetical protein FI667_g685, partial [Globisporangium splendens]